MPDTIEEQLTKHLTDAHSIEVQALLQMRVAPRMARDPQLARAFREHIVETEEQERRVRERLRAHAADPRSSRTWPAARVASAWCCSPARSPTRPESLLLTRTPTSIWSSPPTSCSRSSRT